MLFGRFGGFGDALGHAAGYFKPLIVVFMAMDSGWAAAL